MCMHRSYIVTEDYKVLSHQRCDHHTQIRAEHKIREEGFIATKPHAAIEYRPRRDLFDLTTWECHIDEARKPDWWTKEHQAKTLDKLESEFRKFNCLDSTYVFPGELDLRFLENMRPNATIIADTILLDGLRELPPCTLVARNGITLRGLHRTFPGTNIIAPIIEVFHPEVLRCANVIEGRRQGEVTNDYDVVRRQQVTNPYHYPTLGQAIKAFNSFQP